MCLFLCSPHVHPRPPGTRKVTVEPALPAQHSSPRSVINVLSRFSDETGLVVSRGLPSSWGSDCQV